MACAAASIQFAAHPQPARAGRFRRHPRLTAVLAIMLFLFLLEALLVTYYLNSWLTLPLL